MLQAGGYLVFAPYRITFIPPDHCGGHGLRKIDILSESLPQTWPYGISSKVKAG
jgi:hypothetical protein